MLFYGCGSDNKSQINTAMVRKLASTLPSFFSVDKFVQILQDDGIAAASTYVNSALQIAPKNAALHFLNGFLYEEMERTGDKGKDALAGVAYKAAFGLDPSNSLGCYLYGSHKLRLGEYADAQQFLTYACVLNPKSADSFYALAYCSYYLRDLPVALSSIKTALKLYPSSSSVQRAAAIIFAACGKMKDACQALSCYGRSVGIHSGHYVKVKERVRQWMNLVQCAQKKSTQCTPIPKTNAASPEESTEAETLFIDCYVILLHEEKHILQGNNFLSQLAVNVGSSSEGLATITRSIARATETGAAYATSGGWEKTFAFTVTPVQATYSLNIVNTQKRRVNLLARPTLTTIVGKTATFEDGLVYAAATQGSNGGALINIPTGTNINVTPRQLTESDEVVMDVELATSAFTAAPDANLSISDQLTERSVGSVSATVKTRVGQTIVIAGSHEVMSTLNRNETPGLSSIPIVQYFVAQKVENQVRRNTLYLITVRRSGEKRKKKESLLTPSQSQRFLKYTGFWALGEYTTLFYILQFLESAPMFADFRSGDLEEPLNSFYIMSLEEKLSHLARFLYF